MTCKYNRNEQGWETGKTVRAIIKVPLYTAYVSFDDKPTKIVLPIQSNALPESYWTF